MTVGKYIECRNEGFGKNDFGYLENDLPQMFPSSSKKL